MVTARTFRNRANKQQTRIYARVMRREPTDCEKKFWYQVRDRRLGGHKFKRQVPIGSYIADFVCIDRKVIVELDGGQHADRIAYDVKRDSLLNEKGFRVIRILNVDFLENPDGVMEMLLNALDAAPSP